MIETKKTTFGRSISFENSGETMSVSIEMTNITNEDMCKAKDFIKTMVEQILREINDEAVRCCKVAREKK